MYERLRSIKEKEVNVLIWKNVTNCLAKWKTALIIMFLTEAVYTSIRNSI